MAEVLDQHAIRQAQVQSPQRPRPDAVERPVRKSVGKAGYPAGLGVRDGQGRRVAYGAAEKDQDGRRHEQKNAQRARQPRSCCGAAEPLAEQVR